MNIEQVKSHGAAIAHLLEVNVARWRADYGWSFEAVPYAPSTLHACTAAWGTMVNTGAPFPVFAGARSIYPTHNHNHMFRMVHAGFHVLRQSDMSLAGETRVHQAVGAFLFRSPGTDYTRLHTGLTLTERVYVVNSMGQSLLHDICGGFPEDQCKFVSEILTLAAVKKMDLRELVQHWIKVTEGEIMFEVESETPVQMPPRYTLDPEWWENFQG